MPSFATKQQKRLSETKPKRYSFDRSDPLAALSQNESPEARRAEDERSERIDRELQAEQKEKKRNGKTVSELEILLLGPSGSGKSTFLKQLRLAYDIKGLDLEREASRLVILLNIVQSTRALLSLLESTAGFQASPLYNSGADSPFRPLSPGGAARDIGPRNEQEANYRCRVRLAPLLGLESSLRQALGAIASGPSAPSVAAHAADRSGFGEGVQKLGWRDKVAMQPINPYEDEVESLTGSVPMSDDRPVSREGSSVAWRAQVRSRTSSPTNDSDPIFSPNFAEKVGTFVVGNGKESRRARAQGSQNGDTPRAGAPGSSVGPDGKFLAGDDDPIHLLAALKEEVKSLWQEAVSRGLIAGEGPRESSRGGFELSESAIYFLQALDRISKPEWLPTDNDILNVRVRTTGIETHMLQITPNQVYKICDVAGARGIRHTWAPYFSDSAAIIFIAACSDYTVCDPGNPQRNRFTDALDLFEDITSNPILQNVTMIVFLNKTDILRKRIKSGLYPLKNYLSGYPGGDKTGDVLSFMQSRFERRHDKRLQVIPNAPPRSLYSYVTQANDTQSIRFVLAAVTDILMRTSLTASGLL